MQEAESLSQNMNRELSSVDCSKRGHLDKKRGKKQKLAQSDQKNEDFGKFGILMKKKYS